jgi:segregation and condensation protein A
VQSVLHLLPDREPMSFRALVAGAPHKLEVIVRFLAILELYKQGFVDLTQFSNFGELMVRRLSEGERLLDAASLDDWADESPLDASPASGPTSGPAGRPAVGLGDAPQGGDDDEDARIDAEIDAEIADRTNA